jgi:hypothetical protein
MTSRFVCRPPPQTLFGSQRTSYAHGQAHIIDSHNPARPYLSTSQTAYLTLAEIRPPPPPHRRMGILFLRRRHRICPPKQPFRIQPDILPPAHPARREQYGSQYARTWGEECVADLCDAGGEDGHGAGAGTYIPLGQRWSGCLCGEELW